MALPFMLIFLSIVTIVASRIYATVEQQRGAIRVQVQHSQAFINFLTVEDFVINKLPLLDLKLYQRLVGDDETAPVKFSIPISDGDLIGELQSAQTCLNIAPLNENDKEEKDLTRLLLSRLSEKYQMAELLSNPTILEEEHNFMIPEELEELICYLPGAGQHWEYSRLTIKHLPLLNVLLPNTSVTTLKEMLNNGLTTIDAEKINSNFRKKILINEAKFYWLVVEFNLPVTTFYSKSLIQLSDRNAHIIFRHLTKDNAL